MPDHLGREAQGAATDHVARIIAAWRRERPDLDPGPQGIIGRIHRIAATLTEELVATYGRYGLGEGEFDVLATLRRAGEPFEHRPSELAQHTMVTSGAMTKRIDRLEAAGLVTRRVSATDGRARVVALTGAGRELIDRAFTEHIANEHRLLASLSPADRTELERILAAWLVAMESAGD
ncbi:MAG: MarR family transcriptional regulator [Cryobacterium sp.]|nr:MarR family transcriptional regulator [Cryobacterium sp.]